MSQAIIDYLNQFEHHDPPTRQPNSQICIRRLFEPIEEVAVYFAPVDDSDWEVLLDTSTAWGSCEYSFFFEIWQSEPQWRLDTIKLTLSEGNDRRIQGILFLDSQAPMWPEGCVIIAAPWNQFGVPGREYSGVGTASVAFLVDESKQRGSNGELRFQIDPAAQEFYEKYLEFTCADPNMPDYYDLSATDATKVTARAKCKHVHKVPW